MVKLFRPGGPMQQLANMWFLLAAQVSDVLLIRLFLCLAYIFLITAACLGMPQWPSASPTGSMALDTVVWGGLSLAFHGLSFFLLLWDERRVRFRSEDEEQLWRFMYRRSGMGRLEMKEVLKYGSWRRVPAGQHILARAEARLRFCLLVEGRACFQALYQGAVARTGPQEMLSGSCFDMGLLNVFGVFIGLEKDDTRTFAAVAQTDCLLYTWSLQELEHMATQLAPAVGAFWRNFTLCQMGLKFTARVRPAGQRLCATGQPEYETVLKGGRSRDFRDPLRPYEEQRPTVWGLLRWFLRSFNPFPPAGLRHTALPVTGILARNRMIAVKTALARAILEEEQSQAGSSDAELEGLSEHGGELVFEMLAKLPTLRHIHNARAGDLVHGCAVCTAAAKQREFERSLSTPSSTAARALADVA